MKTAPVSLDDLARSVIAVPPLARAPDLGLAKAANETLIRHLQNGGVSTLMYGGNANFYNIPLSEYADTLTFLIRAAAEQTWIIPAVGPDYGRIVDQTPILRDLGFPTAMALPATGAFTQAGLATALRRFSDGLGKPVMLYLRQDNYLPVATVRTLIDDGVVGWIKYAVVRQNPSVDSYLSGLVDAIDPRRIISGIGERPVLAHYNEFGLTSFTSGSVAVGPRGSTAILSALKRGDRTAAAALRETFLPLENCRDAHGPARVLHDAVTLAGIADMGPIAPLMSNLVGAEREETAIAARALFALDREKALA